MFPAGEIAKILIPNEVNEGFDYRLAAPADIGDLVSVPVLNKVFLGIVIGAGDGNIPMEKIRPVLAHHGYSFP
ncbi:MAG: hypothetical protein LBL21_03195, partial [Rickettsiales bacterium]|nr:hypothetical protein [Rickettsiales bacterium]